MRNDKWEMDMRNLNTLLYIGNDRKKVSSQLTKRHFFIIFITYFFGITKFFRIFAGD